MMSPFQTSCELFCVVDGSKSGCKRIRLGRGYATELRVNNGSRYYNDGLEHCLWYPRCTVHDHAAHLVDLP